MLEKILRKDFIRGILSNIIFKKNLAPSFDLKTCSMKKIDGIEVKTLEIHTSNGKNLNLVLESDKLEILKNSKI